MDDGNIMEASHTNIVIAIQIQPTQLSQVFKSSEIIYLGRRKN